MNKTTVSHTPGPWHAYVQQDMDKPAFHIDCDAGIVKCPLRMKHSEIRANAALIAAAPELLALCKEAAIIDAMTPMGRLKFADKLEAIIGKAEGAM